MTREANWGGYQYDLPLEEVTSNGTIRSTYSEHWGLHGNKYPERKGKPGLDVGESLFELAQREVGFVTPLTILDHAKGEHMLLARVEEPGIVRTVGHEDVKSHTGGRRNGSTDDEEYTPRCQT